MAVTIIASRKVLQSGHSATDVLEPFTYLLDSHAMDGNIDTDQLVLAIVAELRRTGPWLTFRQLALRIRGDVEDAHLLAAIVATRSDLFVIHNDMRVKLRVEAIQEIFSRSVEQAPIAPPSLHAEAAAAVTEYARQLRPLQFQVVSSDQGRRVLDRYVHGLKVDIADDDIKLADDTPVELISTSGRKNSGHVAGASRDEEILYVAFRDQMLPGDLPARLEVSRSKMLFDIASRLQGLLGPPPLGLDPNAVSLGPSMSAENSRELAEMLSKVRTPWTRLLWGPPGAGKTHSLAELCSILLESSSDERILIVAPSNVAVDSAMIELLAAFQRHPALEHLLTERRVVRFGYPRDERVLGHPELFGPVDRELLSEEVATLHRTIRAMKEGLAPEDRIAIARAELHQLQERIKERLTSHLSNARLVATTVASAFTGQNTLAEAGAWGTVAADEASMINAAIVLALASIAKKRLLLVGDPRQLAPIFEWQRGAAPDKVEHWLGKDPYEFSTISVGSGWDKQIRTDDSRIARVLSQRRCHPRIWSLVESLYPAVASGVSVGELDSIASAPPLPGEPAVLMDVSSPSAAEQDDLGKISTDDLAQRYLSACRKSGKTWENPPTAWLAIDLAREIRAHAPGTRIAIITPYRGQVKLVRRWLHEEIKIDSRLEGIEVGTVHSFQGGEADAVIFDVVDGSPRPGPGVLLRDDAGMRLVNVAITRARGKLVIIADKQWLQRTQTYNHGLLWTIFFGLRVKPASCVVKPLQLDRETPSSNVEGTPESPIEEMLASAIRTRVVGSHILVLQHRIKDENGKIVSRADMAFPTEKLAIFCDGARFHLERNQWQRDLRQRRELTRLGWRFLAYSGSEIMRDVQQCAGDVMSHLMERP
jgi:very-short-patch-repair endonuclease